MKGVRNDRKIRHNGLKSEMKRKDINYSIDMAMLLSFILCGITGIIKWPGLAYSLGLDYQSLNIGVITLIHDWSGLALCILSMMHVIMHRKWLVTMTRRKLRI
ncbi:DUF4405 domain-containing protein [Methanogenium sp. MK-MG]|uniref:DUF4405 domain-containing protein n=1 Tax=Methanogenium sp. MK-MG TaxID=2599926 RepID=UPI0013EB1B44|nr:DUF4405 domain-containing protein [Methanogenium sp. MK-MG]KAF1076397.1 hypothetical protein MKMG_01533 [Methanogenium sp. MK-MG]